MEGVGPHDIDHGMVVGADGVAKAQPREAELEEEGEGEDGRGVGADELEQTFRLLSVRPAVHERHKRRGCVPRSVAGGTPWHSPHVGT